MTDKGGDRRALHVDGCVHNCRGRLGYTREAIEMLALFCNETAGVVRPHLLVATAADLCAAAGRRPAHEAASRRRARGSRPPVP